MMNNTNTASKAATKTEITGRDARTCTGTNLSGERVTFAVGEEVYFHVCRPADDGGELNGTRHGIIERIAQGTEYGMHGTTAIVTVRVRNEDPGYPDVVLLAARHLARSARRTK